MREAFQAWLLSRGDAALVVFLAIGVHVGALGLLPGHPPVELTYDDTAIIAGSPRLVLRSFDDLERLITDKYWGDRFESERLWRPLPLVSFALDRTLLGPQPWRYRWTSVALHALAAWLCLLLFRQLLPRRLALAGALLFAAHPVHAEATSGVVGRAEVLALLGNLGGVLLHLQARRCTRWWGWLLLYLLAAAAFFLGFLSKEIALTGPVVLMVVELALRRPPEERVRNWPQRLAFPLPYLVYAGVIVAYGAARYFVLGDLVAQQGARTLGAMPFDQRLLVAGQVALQNWGSLVLPHTTAGHYPFKPPTLNTGIPILLIQAMFVGAALILLARRARLGRALGLGILATYMSMGPVLNLIPIGVVRADRLLYTPSLYGCLAIVGGGVVAVWLVTLPVPARRPEVGRWVLALTLVAYGWINARNVRAWTNNEALWRTTTARYPDQPRPKLNLGMELLNLRRQGDPFHRRDPQQLKAEAQRLLHEAAQGFHPGQPGWPRQAAQSRAALANVLLDEHPETARVLYVQAQQIDSGCELAALGLVNYHLNRAAREPNPALKQRDLNYAEKEARAAANRVAPHSYQAWLLWGTTLFNLPGRERDAEAAYTKAISLKTRPWEAHANRARLRRLALEDLPGALADYRAVVAALLRVPPARLRGDPEVSRPLRQAILYQAALAKRLQTADAAALLAQSQRLAATLFPDGPEVQILRRLAE